MLYTPKVKQALKLCFAVHKDQTDKGGMPYVFHPVHLAEQMQTEEQILVALLHDVVEDSPYTLADLEAMGFGAEVIRALALLTHQDGMDYMEYIHAIKGNNLARQVKLADLRHNSDLTRLEHVGAQEMQRLEKYRRAIAVLLDDGPQDKKVPLPPMPPGGTVLDEESSSRHRSFRLSKTKKKERC